MIFSSRLITFFTVIALGLLPPLTATTYYITKRSSLKAIAKTFETTRASAYEKKKKQALNTLIKKEYLNADNLYIDKCLETLVFLKPNSAALTDRISTKSSDENVFAHNRLSFLAGPDNKLLFSEIGIVTQNDIKETIESLMHPVEINCDDLTTILSLIEGPTDRNDLIKPKRPQLIITDFTLKKRQRPGRQETFELTTTILQRDFL